MRKIRTDLVTDPSVLQPFTTKSLQFLQSRDSEFMVMSILSQFKRYFVGGSVNYEVAPFFRADKTNGYYGIYAGVENQISGTSFDTVTGGVLMYVPKGSPVAIKTVIEQFELIEVVGLSPGVTFTNPPYLQPVVSYISTDPVTFSDSTIKSVHGIVKYNVVDGAFAGATTLSYNGNIYDPILFSDLDSHTFRVIQARTGSGVSGLVFQKYFNEITLTGTITQSGAFSSTLTSSLTPPGPTSNQTFGITVLDDSTYRPAVITINGATITVAGNFTGVTSRVFYLSGIKYYANMSTPYS